MRNLRKSSIVLPLLFLLSCEEQEIAPTIDQPLDFIVSKGEYVDRIVLQWDIPPLAERFQVFRTDTITEDYRNIAEVVGSSFADTVDLSAGKQYFYKIRVYNSAEEFSEFTNYDKGYVSELLPPSILSVSYGVSDKLFLNWGAAIGAERYIISRASNEVNFEEIDTTESTSWEDQTISAPGETQFYKIQSYHSRIGASGFSEMDSGYVLERYALISSFGNFSMAYGIEFDDEDQVYIGDFGSGAVGLYGKDFSFVDEVVPGNAKRLSGLEFTNGKLFALSYFTEELLAIPGDGTAVTHLTLPDSGGLLEVGVDAGGDFYITSIYKNTISKVSDSGDILTTWQLQQIDPENSFYTSGLEVLNDKIYVGGVNSSAFIEVYSTEGTFIKKWNFSYPAAYISSDVDGNLYFATFSNVIVKTDINGKRLAIIGGEELDRTHAVNVNRLGEVFVTDEESPTKVFVYKRLE